MKKFGFMVRAPVKITGKKIIFIGFFLFMGINIFMIFSVFHELSLLSAYAKTQRTLYAETFAPPYYNDPPMNISHRAHEQGQEKNWKAIDDQLKINKKEVYQQ